MRSPAVLGKCGLRQARCRRMSGVSTFQPDNQPLQRTGATTVIVIRSWPSAPARDCRSVSRMPGPLSDCYVLSPDRSAAAALRFLDEFVPERSLACEPDDASEVLSIPLGSSVADAMGFLGRHPDRSYLMYFRNTAERSPYFAILSYGEDGSLVLGLSGDEDPAAASTLLRRLESFAGSMGYWSVEEAPAASRHEFLLSPDSRHLTFNSSRRLRRG